MRKLQGMAMKVLQREGKDEREWNEK